jgi:transcription elongation factor S-II
MSGTIYGLLLATKGEVKRVKLRDTGGSTPLTQEALQTIIKKKTPLTKLGTYEYGIYAITLFGNTTGKAGTENKHELPPPLDESLYFSDILLIASKKKTTWEHPVSFTPEQYEKFYQSAVGGFEDLEDDEDDDDEEDDEEEEEEVVEVQPVSSVKKKVEEEGIPEDEAIIEEEAEAEGEEEEEEDEEGEEMPGGEEDDEPVPVKARRTSKKKAVKANLTVAQNTGRAKQQALLMQQGLLPIENPGPIPSDESDESNETRIRSHTVQLIQRHLGAIFSPEDQDKLELSIFQNALLDADVKYVVKHFDNTLFQICYKNATRRILSNLDPTNYVRNTHLLTKLQQGDLQIEHLATMNCMDYAPALYTSMRDRMLLREQQQLDGNKAMATDMFKCGRCHKREATFYELQTRSADEPMTKFITCVNCGNHWKQ